MITETSDKHILTKLMFWKETPIHWQTKLIFWQWILVILAYKNSVITINTCYYENWNWMCGTGISKEMVGWIIF
jgi:hypothetical protein